MMRRSVGPLASLSCLLALACSGDPASPDAGRGDAGTRNGCPVLAAPQARAGDPIEGDTWETHARDFFAAYCTRCHASARTTSAERSGAPPGRDWDDPAVVRSYLPQIRLWVGELNAMPIGAPAPSCDERRRLVRWIDAAAP